MAAISRMKVGQVLWNLKRVRMGNTTVSITSCYPVRITEISESGGSVMASWNSNTPRRMGQGEVNRLRVNKPQPKRTIMGMSDYSR